MSGSVNGCAVGSQPTLPRVAFIGVSETCVSMGLGDVTVATSDDADADLLK
jgi:hypothetical protein